MDRLRSLLLKPLRTTTIITYCLLGAAALVAVVLPDNLIDTAKATDLIDQPLTYTVSGSMD